MTLVPPGKHAIVIGARMGGLAAAAVVGGQFERVTVLERDVLPLDVAWPRCRDNERTQSIKISFLVMRRQMQANIRRLYDA